MAQLWKPVRRFAKKTPDSVVGMVMPEALSVFASEELQSAAVRICAALPRRLLAGTDQAAPRDRAHVGDGDARQTGDRRG